MKQRAHAWCALRALKLIDDSGAAPGLSELLCFYLSDVWEGAWLPDTLIADMSYGHTFKMDSDPALLGFPVEREGWLRVPYEALKKKLKGKRLCLELAASEPELHKSYRSHPVKGGHLPNRVIAVSHSIGDMLKLSDYPLAFYARQTKASAYLDDLSAKSVKDLSGSPNYSGRQIALAFFMLAHYVTDAHMPLHCDLRDYGSDGSPTRRLPRTLHPSIEEEWEKHFPDKDVLTLHRYSKRSLDQAVKALPKGSVIKIDADRLYALGAKVPACGNDEWTELVYTCRASYALSRAWIIEPYKNAAELIARKGDDSFALVTNFIFHDAVLSTAALWMKAWKRFVG